ncbi:LOW QUALITY PROTEIN: alpha-1A adrenergic receptor-like [Scylla paramamosain]|uniref:LOW QUALITY PROTEIN: alpha-1A adrenergic receptor-like n=1 Tax=Scylla paramamosain TaxID=85552 RepID=UPI003082C635
MNYNFTLEILNTSWIFDDYDFDFSPKKPPVVDIPANHNVSINVTPATRDQGEVVPEVVPEGRAQEWMLELVVKSVILAIIVVLTIGGNVLVLLAVFMSRNLRSSTHYLIVNLAVADLLLGTTVLPFSATLEVSGKWYFGQVFCEVWATADVLCCTASIWSLCVISLDRYIGVTRPLAYSSIMTERRMCVLIAAVWALSIAISIGPAFGWKTPPDPDPTVCTVNQELGYVLFSVTGSFYLPSLFILILYWRIYRAAIQQSKFLESGIKTTKTSVTLRVHRGGDTRLTLRAHRGGMGVGLAAGMAAGLATGVGGLNGHCLVNGDLKPSEKEEKPGLRVNEGKKTMSRLMPPSPNLGLPVTPFTWQGRRRSARNGQDQSGEAATSNQETSPSASPERRLTGPTGGKMAKFRRQKKAAKTLGIVVGVFLLCWFPFFFILPLDSLCGSCRISETLFATFFWLGYFNSCLNPFIYACTSREFKRAFKRDTVSREGTGAAAPSTTPPSTPPSGGGTLEDSALTLPAVGSRGFWPPPCPWLTPAGAVWKAPKAP